MEVVQVLDFPMEGEVQHIVRIILEDVKERQGP